MPYQLKIDEVLQALHDHLGDTHIDYLLAKTRIEKAASDNARVLARHLDIELLADATFEGMAFAGTCAPFGAKFEGQVCPEVIAEYDAPAEENFEYYGRVPETAQQGTRAVDPYEVQLCERCGKPATSERNGEVVCSECGADLESEE